MELQNHRVQRSVPDLLRDIVDNLEDIARSELLLMKVALQDEAAGMANASKSLAFGAVFAFYAGGFALLAGMYALAAVLPLWEAALAVSIVVGIIALVMITRGKTNLKVYAESKKSVTKVLDKETQRWTNTPSRSSEVSSNGVTVLTTTSTN